MPKPGLGATREYTHPVENSVIVQALVRTRQASQYQARYATEWIQALVFFSKGAGCADSWQQSLMMLACWAGLFATSPGVYRILLRRVSHTAALVKNITASAAHHYNIPR